MYTPITSTLALVLASAAFWRTLPWEDAWAEPVPAPTPVQAASREFSCSGRCDCPVCPPPPEERRRHCPAPWVSASTAFAVGALLGGGVAWRAARFSLVTGTPVVEPVTPPRLAVAASAAAERGPTTPSQRRALGL